MVSQGPTITQTNDDIPNDVWVDESPLVLADEVLAADGSLGVASSMMDRDIALGRQGFGLGEDVGDLILEVRG